MREELRRSPSNRETKIAKRKVGSKRKERKACCKKGKQTECVVLVVELRFVPSGWTGRHQVFALLFSFAFPFALVVWVLPKVEGRTS